MDLLSEKERIEKLMKYLREYEPYDLDVLNVIDCDEKYIGDMRFVSTMALEQLIEEGYKEEEVNPWMNKSEVKKGT